jgi:flagellar biosynthesis component FlhA
LDVKELSKLVTDLGEVERRLTLGGTGFVLVVPDRLRAAISEVLRRRGRVVPVLAQREIDDTAKVAVVAKI